MGFTRVYDYVAGKADWGAAGLPLEGTVGARAGDLARVDVPTCRLDEPLGDVRARAGRAGWDTCLVVNEERVVLGQVGRRALNSEGGDSRTVEEVMRPGPSTVRPSRSADSLAERMERNGLTSVVVTRSDGRLVGVVRREDVAPWGAGSVPPLR